MRTYIVDELKIVIGAKVTAVHYGGRTIIPKESRPGIFQKSKAAVKQFWRNNYFRRKTKSYLGVKAAELGLRSISVHQLYILARDHLYPYWPMVKPYLELLDLKELIIVGDKGFFAGVLITFILVRLKRRFGEGINFRRSVKSE